MKKLVLVSVVVSSFFSVAHAHPEWVQQQINQANQDRNTQSVMSGIMDRSFGASDRNREEQAEIFRRAQEQENQRRQTEALESINNQVTRINNNLNNY